MANDGQIVFEVTADGKHAIANIKDITRAIQQESKKWDDAAEESTQNIESSFSSMLKKVAAGFSAAKIGKALVDFGKQALQAASDLEEVQNVVDTTFGQAGAAQIESWAKNAATQFGLTELQAKKFSSTLGAMMKSSGLSGNEITEMSTSLAGLAADMASFYNLDFEEAFAKIRSGISGETEPLKQLGINMSVANMEAYALSKGITKAFNEMSQGEQTMLRYQYLMSATADAQGDFAKTSDGFANSLRLMETEMQTLHSKVGEYLVPAMGWVVSSINSVFQGEQGDGWSRRRTVLDDISDIDASTQTAIENIELTKSHVAELTKNLEEIGNEKGKAEKAAGSIGTAVGGLSSLASELSKVKIEDGAKEAFESTLAILYNNIDNLSEIKEESSEGVKKWLDGVAEEAQKLKPEDAEAWATLLGSLVGDIPGLENTEDGQNLIQQLTSYYLALGKDSAEAAEGLSKLGYGTEDIERLQSDWLATCKELVRTMPGLSDIIDTQTGEVKGGIPAIKAYADEWERMAKYEAQMQGLTQKKELVTGLQTETEFRTAADSAEAKARAYLSAYGKLTQEQVDAVIEGAKRYAEYAYNGENWDGIGRISFDEMKNSPWLAYNSAFLGDSYNDTIHETEGLTKAYGALTELLEAEYDQIEFLDIQPKLIEEYDRALEQLAEETGKTKEELEAEAAAALEAQKNMSLVERAAQGDEKALSDLNVALENAKTAFAAWAEYAENAHKKVADSVNSTVRGFEKLDTYSKKLSNVKEKVRELTAEQAKHDTGSQDWLKVQKQIDEANASVASRGSMLSALESQKEFMEEYLANLEAAQKMGLSNELLASLSDGSAESAEYLAALVSKNTDTASAKEIDAMYQKVQEKKKELTDALTEQQLTVDEVYQALADDAKKAVEALDLEGEAQTNTDKTVTGVLTALQDKLPGIKEAVNDILAEIAKLSGLNIGVDFGAFSSVVISKPNYGKTSEKVTAEPLAVGMDFVPFDGYLAALHQGEAVLTAEENRVWQTFKNGGVGTDYDTMGSVMRDNIKPGGNVYLDGRVVGSVISEQQGRSYRQLQRSGWQG